jgi:hypothetical protein
MLVMCCWRRGLIGSLDLRATCSNILDVIGKAGAAFKSLGDAWADTTTPHGRLMLTVLGGVAAWPLAARAARGQNLLACRDRDALPQAQRSQFAIFHGEYGS